MIWKSAQLGDVDSVWCLRVEGIGIDFLLVALWPEVRVDSRTAAEADSRSVMYVGTAVFSSVYTGVQYNCV